jgi:hypothetical protein
MYKKKLWKESLNSDGQQFHQYQQNEQPPLTLKPLNTNKTATYGGTGNPVCKQYTIIKMICFSIHLNSRSHKNIIKQKIIRRYKSYLFLFEFKGVEIWEITLPWFMYLNIWHGSTLFVQKLWTKIKSLFCTIFQQL